MWVADIIKTRRKLMLIVGLLCVVVLGGVLLADRMAVQKNEQYSGTFRLAVFPEKYATIMSSTPGLQLSAEYQGAVGKVRFAAEKGEFLEWNTATGRIYKGGKVMEVLYGIPVYWSPLEPNGGINEEKETGVTVTLLDKKGDKIDEKKITIVYDGSFYTVEPAQDIIILEKEQPRTQGTASLDDAVGLAIKAQSSGYGAGEIATEGHLILDTEESSGKVKVYTIASFCAFGFENGIFTTVSGSGAIPTVMVFERSEKGEYVLLEYKEPQDGAGYTDSIKKMFPIRLQDRVFAAQNDRAELIKQQEAQAAEYLKSIGRGAKVSAGYVQRELINIDVEASNKLFAEFTKYNAFLNACPYWLGTREQVENGVRYIYETSQSKSNDGFDMITFKKYKEDETVVEEYRYKIVGSEPQLLK